MSSAGLVLVTSGSAARMGASAPPWGTTVLAMDRCNGIIGVIGTSSGAAEPEVDQAMTERHPITLVPERGSGCWAIVDPALHNELAWLRRIDASLPADAFRPLLAGFPEGLPAKDECVVVTRAPGATLELAAWQLTAEQATPLEIEVLEPTTVDPIQDLGRHWPVRDLDGRVVVVGLGSIGSAAALALARYGVRDLVLVDPDRLRPHNLVRHQCTRADVGRYKVDAVRDAILDRWPSTRVNAMRLDAIGGADRMRPLLRDSGPVLCAADGVAARRCVNHLARRAGCTAVFACVLRDGALGEVLRVRPWPGNGCLLCIRALLVEHGTIDPEPQLDATYGTGNAHRPMTAVGSDLELVGGFAAKVAVATLLEEASHYEQLLRQDWALIGLRMDRSAPAPFDLFPGHLHWLPHAGEISSRPNCPTCGGDAVGGLNSQS